MRPTSCQIFLSFLIVLAAGSGATAQFTYNWAAATSGNWSNSSSWTPGFVPTASDNAVIAATGSNYTATVDGSFSVAGLTLSSANATLGGTSGPLTIGNGGFIWSAGTINVPLILNGGGALNTGGTLAVGSTGNLTVAGGTFVINRNLPSPSNVRPLNIGTDGTFNIAGDYMIGSLWQLNNAGVLQKTSGTGVSEFTLTTNTGTIRPLTGQMTFDLGFTNTGVLDFAGTGQILINSGPLTLNPGTTVTGNSQISLDNSTLTVNTPTTINSLGIFNSTVTGAAPLTVVSMGFFGGTLRNLNLSVSALGMGYVAANVKRFQDSVVTVTGPSS
jgi:hypothetical protein